MVGWTERAKPIDQQPGGTMTQIELLEQQIAELDEQSFARLREWFIEFDHARWDNKIEADSNSGKLDFLIDSALTEYKAGNSTDL